MFTKTGNVINIGTIDREHGDQITDQLTAVVTVTGDDQDSTLVRFITITVDVEDDPDPDSDDLEDTIEAGLGTDPNDADTDDDFVDDGTEVDLGSDPLDPDSDDDDIKDHADADIHTTA